MMLDQTAHRPWALPKGPWVLSMRWHDLLFLHWPVRPDSLRALIPHALELDTFDGWCWLGVVPFRMTRVHPRWVPVRLAFPELNVRTYVKTPNRPGVWFFSLDAGSSRVAVRAARLLGMPYYDARMSLDLRGETVKYHSMRTHSNSPCAEFDAACRPTGAVFQPIAGTFDHWLTERYRLSPRSGQTASFAATFITRLGRSDRQSSSCGITR